MPKRILKGKVVRNKSEKTIIVDEEDLDYQKAPLVGTFYTSSKPGEPVFVNVGDKVSKGQVLCIIEAMKIFNEIESDFDGIIVEILAANFSQRVACYQVKITFQLSED